MYKNNLLVKTVVYILTDNYVKVQLHFLFQLQSNCSSNNWLMNSLPSCLLEAVLFCTVKSWER